MSKLVIIFVTAKFSLYELSHDENETFVDVGCLDAKTSINFVKWSKKYKKNLLFRARCK